MIWYVALLYKLSVYSHCFLSSLIEKNKWNCWYLCIVIVFAIVTCYIWWGHTKCQVNFVVLLCLAATPDYPQNWCHSLMTISIGGHFTVCQNLNFSNMMTFTFTFLMSLKRWAHYALPFKCQWHNVPCWGPKQCPEQKLGVPHVTLHPSKYPLVFYSIMISNS